MVTIKGRWSAIGQIKLKLERLLAHLIKRNVIPRSIIPNKGMLYGEGDKDKHLSHLK